MYRDYRITEFETIQRLLQKKIMINSFKNLLNLKDYNFTSQEKYTKKCFDTHISLIFYPPLLHFPQ